MPSQDELEAAEDANLFEEAVVEALLAAPPEPDVDEVDGEGRRAEADNAKGIEQDELDHVGVEGAPMANVRHAQHGGKKPSRYQIPVGGGNTMNIKTLLSLLKNWFVTKNGKRLPKDRLLKIVMNARTSKEQTQTASAAAVLAGLVDTTTAICGGSWVAVGFENGPGRFRFYLGMVQRIIQRPASKKAYLHYGSLSLDDEHLHGTWLNVAWLTPSDKTCEWNKALQYQWHLPLYDTDEVAAGYTINVPDITFCSASQTYTLAAEDLRRINDFLESITTAEPEEMPLAIATPHARSRGKAGTKDKRRQTGGPSATDDGGTTIQIAGVDGKRSRLQKVYGK